MNESRSDDRFFKKDRSKKFVFKKKLELIEGRNLASIWKCFVQHYIVSHFFGMYKSQFLVGGFRSYGRDFTVMTWSFIWRLPPGDRVSGRV